MALKFMQDIGSGGKPQKKNRMSMGTVLVDINTCVGKNRPRRHIETIRQHNYGQRFMDRLYIINQLLYPDEG